jgi:AmmeMemoRadiSam system protein A
MELSEQERRELLSIAHEAIEARLRGKEPRLRPNAARLTALRAAFVCLKVGQRLRGCIGQLVATGPLWETVRDMAVEAAFADPRFMPLSERELPQIKIEVSVLSEMERLSDAGRVEVGRHGLYIKQGRRGGVLLPQVATELGWDRETFLAETCLKAGLEPECWKRPETEVYVFTAAVFGE